MTEFHALLATPVRPVSEVGPPQPDDPGGLDVDGFSLPLPEAWQPVASAMADYPFLLALLVVFIGVLVAFLLRWITTRVLGRLSRRSKTRVDDELIRVLAKPVFNTILLLSLIVAAGIVMGDYRIGQIIQRLLASLLVLTWIAAALRACHIVLEALARLKQFRIVEPRTTPLFDIIAKLLIVGGGIYFIFIIWGINPAAWIASAGVIGIAVGFAARDTLANLFSGFFIVADSPYKIGDYIVLDTGERGVVTQVGMRSTRLLTRDDVEVTVPNSVIGGGKIVNESGGPWEKFRIRIPVGVAYGSDLDEVMEALLNVTRDHDKVCASPDARVRMRGFGESSVDFELLCWVERPEQRGLVTHELLLAIYRQFAESGIEIPFPQRDLHFRSGAPPQTTGEPSPD